MISDKDKEVFEKEFVPHLDALFNFALHLINNESDADDLLQDTCLKAYRSVGNYHVGTNAKAWLFKIMKNTFINNYRKSSRQGTQVDLEDFIAYHESEENTNYVGYMDLRKDILEGMMGDEVTNAIGELSVEFRMVILLCDIEGFSYEDIATIIDIPVGTVRSRLHRARGVLKEKLSKYAENLGYYKESK